MRLLELLLMILLNKRESNVWYRIDRRTQLGTVLRSQIQIEYGIDAIFAATPYDALAIAATRNSLKHGQLFQAVFSNTMKDHHRAVAISRERDIEIAEFESLMQSIVMGKVYANSWDDQ